VSTGSASVAAKCWGLEGVGHSVGRVCRQGKLKESFLRDPGFPRR
jgi:hypothetical protein